MLFEGYIKDYGPEAGEKIIKVFIDVLGGCRLSVPKKLTNNTANNRILIDLYQQLCQHFRQASGEAIMRNFLMELKGCRISFPSIKTICREERDRKICTLFNGSNFGELALLFGISKSRIKNIMEEK